MKVVWILDEYDDNRLWLSEALCCMGCAPIAFKSCEHLVAHAAHRETARASLTIVDAKTARGHERQVCAAASSRLVILTTWPMQIVPWTNLGVSRFMMKPIESASLLEHLEAPPAQARAAYQLGAVS